MNLADLNPAQKEAVTHGTGPLMIIAGAGTGKTKVITQRIAWLVEQGLAAPQEIVALTFTEKAANEMNERLEKLIAHRALAVTTTTFHGFCQQIINRFGLEIGVTPGAPLLTEVQLWLLLHQQFARLDLKYYRPQGNPTKFLRALIRHIARLKDENISVAQYQEYAESVRLNLDVAEITPQHDEAARLTELAAAYASYQQILLERGLMDFGDLLLYANRLVAERPRVQLRLQQQYKFIVVDEFQDTNMAQYDLVRALLGPTQNITVVGDDDQAIYKFRGASVDNILQFRAHFPTRHEVFLTTNYRSRQEILTAAYQLIQFNNPRRLECDAAGQSTGAKKLLAARGAGGIVSARQFATGQAEARFVATEIATACAQGVPGEEIAVLARAAAHLEEVATALKKQKIPFVIATAATLLNTRVVIDVLSLLRAVLDRSNSVAWYQLCVSRLSDLTPADLITCVNFSQRKNLPLARVLFFEPPVELSAAGRTALQKLAQRVKLEKDFLASNKASVIIYQLLEQAGYFQILLREAESGQGNGAADIALINQFLDFVTEWETQHPGATPYEFLADCDRLLEVGEEAEQQNTRFSPGAVQLLTVHAAKGLEFRQVYVVSLVEGRFPATARAEAIEIPDALVREKNISAEHHLEEERRLAYVASTRAQDKLVLTRAEKYSVAEGARARKASRFVGEAGLVELAEGTAAVAAARSTPVTTALPDFFSTAAVPAKEEYSFTQLKTFENCPYQYWFAHLLHLPVKQKWTMNFGKSLHAALQQWYELIREQQTAQQGNLFAVPAATENKIPPPEKLIEILQRVWISAGYPTAQLQAEKKQTATEMLRAYYRAHAAVWRVPAHIEQRFKIVVGGEVVRGSIDRIDVHPDGTVEIVDYKTGAAKDAEKITFADKEQLLLYHLAAERQLALRPTLLTYYYLQDQSTVTFTATPKDLVKIEEQVAALTTEIKRGHYPATPSPFVCRFCDYKEICPRREL